MQSQPNQQSTFDESLFRFSLFESQKELDWMMQIIRSELAEPYSIFTYNYFLTLYSQNTIMAYYGDQIVGCIIAKCEKKKSYIAMLVVEKSFRRHKIGKKLFDQFLRRVEGKTDKIVLETECINTTALKFYESLGFIKTRRMLNYYMSGNDAFRLKLHLNKPEYPRDAALQVVSSDDEY